MATKIKLMRLGKIRSPHYRIVIADARTKRDGRVIETIGKYHPKEDPSVIEVDSDRAQYWLGVGAQPTEPVQRILEVTGDWQRFKGQPGTEGTLQVAKPKPSKQELFNLALAEAGSDPLTEATTPKRRSGGRRGEADAAKADGAKAESGGGKARAKKADEGADAADTAADMAAEAPNEGSEPA